ncbi:hypothetical protein L249_7132 [Ophiocordyceps polyrhachis-furcata BCC 54312]|uniref:HTH myb-type domain-containing protein n=1 Tax=Ophiocordyceps polyrhachis-furcata BCC 54312 TaxID=1330021 RepID=A0A367LAB6_9HYPO|nr:hypothetical protein L249_7132 [Ophiocordyceps polyrhachis-furcata BCC 54312]
MAEPAQTEHYAAPYIKQEYDVHAVQLAGQLGPKRPLDHDRRDDPEAKRSKTENVSASDSLDDGLALLVQNALSSVGDLVDQINAKSTTTMHLDTPPQDGPRSSFAVDPQVFIRDMNVHSLANLALSLLHIYVQKPLQQTFDSIRDAESEHGRCYRQLRHSFEQLRLLYTSKPVLYAKDLDPHRKEQRALVELINLAQLGSWLIDGSPQALAEAQDNFLSLFNCQVADLPPGMTELYLGIMAQGAVESLVLRGGEKSVEQLLGEVFLAGLDDKLRRHHGNSELTSADQNFVKSVNSWRETIEREAREQADPTALRQLHPFKCLLRLFVCYVRGRLRCGSYWSSKLDIKLQLGDEDDEAEADAIAVEDGDNVPRKTTDQGLEMELDLDEISSFLEKETSGLVQDALTGLPEDGGSAGAATASDTAKADSGPTRTNGKADLMTDYKELEALVAESTSHYVKTTLNGLSPVPYQPTVPQSTAEVMASQPPYLHPYYTGYSQHPAEAEQATPGEDLPPNQTFPSAILYDKARQAALCKTTAHTRREGIHSTRRPWSQEEEKALMAGLDMVKGPHWSQILTLFGQNGTISDILKDRTQVQLKDKARNLKLFFLKTSSEMPYYLQAVTGELKTRAPTQAARKEAEVRAKQSSEEDQARLQGIMALAGGLKDPLPPPPSSSSSSSSSSAGFYGKGGVVDDRDARSGTGCDVVCAARSQRWRTYGEDVDAAGWAHVFGAQAARRFDDDERRRRQGSGDGSTGAPGHAASAASSAVSAPASAGAQRRRWRGGAGGLGGSGGIGGGVGGAGAGAGAGDGPRPTMAGSVARAPAPAPFRPRLAPAPAPAPAPVAAPVPGQAAASTTQQTAPAPEVPKAPAPAQAALSTTQQAASALEAPSQTQAQTQDKTRTETDVDGAEAVLLEGLQAVVAQTLA